MPDRNYSQTLSIEFLACLGGRPANFGKKIKVAEENLGKNHQNSVASMTPLNPIV